MKKETRFQNRVRPFLKTLKNSWATKVQQISISGSPDFLLCVNGHFVGLELKSDRHADLTELQRYNLKRIRESGGIGIVCHPENWSTVSHYLMLLSEGLSKEKDLEAIYDHNQL